MHLPPRHAALSALLAAQAALAQPTLLEAPPTPIPQGTIYDDDDYTIVIKEGADIGGVFTVGDRDNPQLRPLNQITISGGTVPGAIVYNAESLAISGGTIGRILLWVNGAQNLSISGGTIDPEYRITDIKNGDITGGTFGTRGQWENSNLDIAGGNFNAASILNSNITIHGDPVFHNLSFDDSNVQVRGGTFENCGMIGTINTHAGRFEKLTALGGSVTINDGQFQGTLSILNNAQADIRGGTHNGTILALPGCHLTIHGTDFVLDAQPLDFETTTTIPQRNTTLRVRLADGNVIVYNLNPVITDDGGTGIYEDHCDPNATLQLTRTTPNTDLCYADWNNNASVDSADLADFITDFAAAAPRADLRFDARLDFFDIAAFVAAFDAGCP